MIDKSGKFWKGENTEDIKAYLKCFTEDSYQAENFEVKKCVNCGSDEFLVQAKREEQLYRLVCNSCNHVEYVEDSEEMWEDADERITKCKCLGSRGHNIYKLVFGYALRDDGSKNWLYIGYLCSECKVLGCMDDIEIS